ncbi:NAD(+) kinase [[Mycoplasma] cavipharyngis]|uniref:hypothetical protein n=1 Tax=[Mycoplasma] cavipharyngis TaxID=92757 RepID=UPI0037045263
MQYKIITADYQKATDIANQLRQLLEDHQENDEHFEYLFLIGGDGTFAWGVTQHAFIPNLKIIGINSGNVGFFSMFSCDCLDQVKKLVERDDFENLCYQKVDLIDLALNQDHYYSFNDVVFFAKGLLSFDVYIDDNYLEHYRGSGLLFSTKYGSTGYNKSANGPIIFPEVNAWIMNELFAQSTSMIHTIHNPIIIPPLAVVTLKKNNDFRKFRISVDGMELIDTDQNEQINLSLIKSEAWVYFACDSQSYIKKLSSVFLTAY